MNNFKKTSELENFKEYLKEDFRAWILKNIFFSCESGEHANILRNFFFNIFSEQRKENVSRPAETGFLKKYVSRHLQSLDCFRDVKEFLKNIREPGFSKKKIFFNDQQKPKNF